MLNDDPAIAPGRPGWAEQPLWLVQRFVNTVEYGEDHSHEELESPADLREFLVAHAGLDRATKVGPADLRRAIEVREAIRELLRANVPDAPCATGVAAAKLNEEIERARVRARIDDGGHPSFAVESKGVTAAIGRILAALLSAMERDSFHRLKACLRHSCRWVFYDRSKNRSGTWCSMKVCGNREKVRAYRERQSTAT